MTAAEFLDRTERRANGVFYTPVRVADYVVRQVFAELGTETSDATGNPSVLDFSCGDGVFLESAARFSRDLYGVDLDETSVELTRSRLANQVNLHSDNALTLDWVAAFPGVFEQGGFDAIVGNPPYVNIRQLSKHHGRDLKQTLEKQYECATLGYDVYVLFIELATRLLRPGGVCGLVVPNKIATLEYARKCRELLMRETICRIDDLSTANIFPTAAVYPYIVIWKKEPAKSSHRISVSFIRSIDDLDDGNTTQIDQSSFHVDTGFAIHGGLDVESRIATRPLRDAGVVHSGTTGFYAQHVALALVERTADHSPATSFPFIVSRNVDRYSIEIGNVRFMKRRFDDPMLRRDDQVLSQVKRELYAAPKIVIAGMSKRIEAAFDPGGLALGVQVYAVTDFDSDPYFLLGLLNSKLLSHLFRVRFQAKRMSAGYFSVNKRQLEQLPIPVNKDLNTTGREIREQVIRRVGEILDQGVAPETDAQIDELVFDLYGVTELERLKIESEFTPSKLPVRSAA